MNLSELVAKPKLIQITLKDIELTRPRVDINEPETYTTDVTFYTPDRQPLNIYLKLSQSLNKNQEESIDLLKELILDQDGKQIIVDDMIPPVNVMVAAMARVMELLGK